MLSAARHLTSQGNMVRSLGNIAVEALLRRFRPSESGLCVVPGREIRVRVPSPPRALVRDFLRFVGTEPQRYTGVIPPHLFPQWGLPVALQALHGCGYPLERMVNGGCRLASNGPLSLGEPLTVRARLEQVDDNGRRAVLRQRVVTEQDSRPNALVADVYGIISLPRGRSTGKLPSKPKEPVRVPTEAQLLSQWTLRRQDGRVFAFLTGDFNPVHWSSPYARAMGFERTILHGFASMARVFAALEGALEPRKLKVLDLRFTRPVNLPGRVAVYLDADRVFVGAQGEQANVSGSFVATNPDRPLRLASTQS